MRTFRTTLAAVFLLSSGCAHLADLHAGLEPCMRVATFPEFAECAAVPVATEGLEAAWLAAKQNPAAFAELLALVAEAK